MTQPLIDYTKLLNKLDPEPDGEPAIRLRTGTVDAINGDGSVDVALSGVVIPNVPRLEDAEIDVGANVRVLSYLGDLIVIGRTATHGPAWIPFTIGSSGWTPGNAVMSGRFQVDRSKNILWAIGQITFGTTTVVSGNMVLGIPPGWSPAFTALPHIGTGLILQGSARYPFSVEINNSTSIIMVLGDGSIVDSNSPPSWATGSILRFQYMYEIET